MRLAASINQHLNVAHALQGSIAETERRKADLQEQLREAFPRLDTLVEVTKALKKDTEAAVSAAFNKRVIKIIGEVNTI